MSKPIDNRQDKPKTVRASATQTVVIEAGQIWKAGETYIQIKEAGTRLIHYKMAKTLHRPGLRKHLASVKTVRAFLKSRRAELVTELSPEWQPLSGAQ
jgi:hypothetical protein